jgi:N-acetylglucosaminyldiphosphoundecaprenol N-acetyl-beta-D-mannosaminyltransferase
MSRRIAIMGLAFDPLTESQCVDAVSSGLEAGQGGWIITANLDHLRRFVHTSEYRELCARADLVVADGRPILWAARAQGTPLPGQVAGSNLIWSISERAAREGRSVYLLGGDPGTAERAARLLTDRFPGLRVAGACCPETGFDRDVHRVSELTTALSETRPDIVYVALGSPKQEQFIARVRDTLPGSWWIGVGISFSFVCGDVRRAPAWMQSLGLEWLHRLAQEPRRLFKRYVVQGIPFAARLLAHAFSRRVVGVDRSQAG